MGKFRDSLQHLRDRKMIKEARAKILSNRMSTIPEEYRNSVLRRADALKLLSEWDHRCVYICGGVGTGKTTIAIQMLKLLWTENIAGKLINFPKWMESYNNLGKWNTARESRLDELMNYEGVLLLDDFILDKPTPDEIKVATAIIDNRLVEHKYLTIITSNVEINEVLSMYDPKIASRLIGYSGGEYIVTGRDHRNVGGVSNGE